VKRFHCVAAFYNPPRDAKVAPTILLLYDTCPSCGSLIFTRRNNADGFADGIGASGSLAAIRERETHRREGYSKNSDGALCEAEPFGCAPTSNQFGIVAPHIFPDRLTPPSCASRDSLAVVSLLSRDFFCRLIFVYPGFMIGLYLP
jgi:hypothetical protein